LGSAAPPPEAPVSFRCPEIVASTNPAGPHRQGFVVRSRRQIVPRQYGADVTQVDERVTCSPSLAAARQVIPTDRSV